MYEYRCDERLKAKPEGSKRLAYTGLHGGLEHLTIETRLIDERFPSVMGGCVTRSLETIGDPSIFKLIRNDASLDTRMLITLVLNCEENTVRWKWKSPLVGCGN
jgi:hypothetical protein